MSCLRDVLVSYLLDWILLPGAAWVGTLVLCRTKDCCTDACIDRWKLLYRCLYK